MTRIDRNAAIITTILTFIAVLLIVNLFQPCSYISQAAVGAPTLEKINFILISIAVVLILAFGGTIAYCILWDNMNKRRRRGR